MDHRHLSQIKIQLLGHEGCKGGVNALPHLGPRGHDGHAFPVDHDIWVERCCPFGQIILQRVAIGGLVLPPAKGRATSNCQGAKKEGAPDDFANFGHVRALSCAGPRL